MNNTQDQESFTSSSDGSKPQATAAIGSTVTIQGVVTRIFFRDNEKKYYIFNLRVSTNKEVNCKGSMARCMEQVTYKLTGVKCHDATRLKDYLKIESSEEILDATPHGIINYLSQEAPTLGEAGAAKLVSKYGVNTLTILRQHPEKVAAEVAGFDLERVTKISSWLAAESSNCDVKRRMYAIGLTTNQINKLLNVYGAYAETRIKENCFDLIKVVDGMGFLTVAKIADLVGVDRRDPYRIRAAIMYAMQLVCDDGHICVSRSVLINEAMELLGISQKYVADQMDEMLREGMLINGDDPPKSELCLDG